MRLSERSSRMSRVTFNLKSFNYAIGMFGTSIPINMLKTYAAFFYVDKLGLTTPQFSMVLLDRKSVV